MLLDASKAFDRVDYVKLSRLQLDKCKCPVICKLIFMMYTDQSARIRWGGTLSQPFKITNSVRQGGMLSPILFGMYMDNLFHSLSACHVGCHIGNKFMGAFGYADDAILIAPTTRSLYSLLDVCTKFSMEFKVKLNPEKSNLIVFNGNQNTSILFEGQKVNAKPHDVHLGHVLGEHVLDINICNAKHDLIKRLNVLLSNFNGTYIDTIYQLFNVHCMSAYGSVL